MASGLKKETSQHKLIEKNERKHTRSEVLPLFSYIRLPRQYKNKQTGPNQINGFLRNKKEMNNREWERIIVNNVIHKSLLSKLYKKPLHLNIKTLATQ